MTHLSDELIHTTVRIETWDESGNAYTGTGFFFDFEFIGGKVVPMLVTNRHVLRGMSQAALHMTRESDGGTPIFGRHTRLIIQNLQARVLYHPDESTDLALLMVGDTISENRKNGTPLHYKAVSPTHILSPDSAGILTAIEEVLMIGYPNSLWDGVNNLPIVRRGVTATPVERDYEGRAEFVIDAACFPGSSGSPVFLYNEIALSRESGRPILQRRFGLLGVLYAGPQHTVEGTIIVESIPTAVRSVPISRIPMNLGFCVKAHRILDFMPQLWDRIQESARRGGTGPRS
ncbi:MAG: serine protease [Candidatus Eremiobacteraeota bacterium]|nr:serine protease [Candidatus Eremiobacteraeota bacterium]